jgi:hypothetical protein
VLHKELGYMPLPSNAVTCCASGHVLIAEDSRPARLHVHEAHGACREVKLFTHTDLGLEHRARLLAIGYSHEHGGFLQACVGGGCTGIEALHAYRVSQNVIYVDLASNYSLHCAQYHINGNGWI